MWGCGFTPDMAALFDICPSLKWIYATYYVADELTIPIDKMDQIVNVGISHDSMNGFEDPKAELQWDEEDEKMKESYRDYLLTKNPDSYWVGFPASFTIEELQQEQTLVNVHAGWDMEFLDSRFTKPLRITTYVCLDATPLIPEYDPQMVATSLAGLSVASYTPSVPASNASPTSNPTLARAIAISMILMTVGESSIG
ncbi:hypothetical protein HK102_000846 [Quaeritorhiza haematococci]|nr:hypothetical protein HK102_000846 [Quaeritorhiza haematococci]